MRGRLPHPREKGGSDTGPSPVDRRKTGRKHHLICDGRGTPLKLITTAANVNDVTQTLALVDGIPPVGAARAGPAAGPMLCSATRATTPTRTGTRYASDGSCLSSHARAARTSKGWGKLRYVVEQTFALLHHFKRLAVRWERRTELHDALVSLACSLICWRRLKKART